MYTKWKSNSAIFITTQMISLFGSALVQYAITWHITLETQSGVYATIAMVCAFLPNLILSPFAGVWADRYNRKMLIIVSDSAIALTTLALAITFMSGHDYMWLLFVALAVRGFGGAIQSPSVSALLPDIVPPEQITRVNGINSGAQSVVNLLAPILSGALLSFASIESIFFIDVFTALLAVVIIIFFLKLPKVATESHITAESGGYFSQLKAGFTYIRSQRYLLHMLFYLMVVYISSSPIIFLTPIQAVRVFGNEVWYLTAIEMACGLGMMIGGLLMAVWKGFKNKATTLSVALTLSGVFIFTLAFPFNFWVYLICMALCLVMIAVFNTISISVLQLNVSSEYMGRVFAIISMLSSSLMPLGMMFFGPLADVVPIETLLLINGVAVVIVGVCVGFTPSIRKVGALTPSQERVTEEVQELATEQE